MQELVDRVSAATGLEPETAHKAIGIVLGFIQKEVPPEDSAAILDKVPGARQAAAVAAAESDGSTPGLMGLANQLTTAGLDMGDMQSLGREMFAYLRERVGEDAVGQLAGAVPGLAQFM
ncbi:MAG TPA: DUF2267 domain-containing protein [Lichenihabitans sp.]|jgi:hypothetical protein|nr:DUF2267 domain-containing protein [Lichenihabitans sp.]